VAEAPEAADLVREGRVSLPDAKRLIGSRPNAGPPSPKFAIVSRTVRLALPALDVGLAHLSLDEELPQLLARIHRMLAVDTAVILLLDERAGSLRPHAAIGLDETRAHEIAIPVGKGFAGRVADECRPLMSSRRPTDVLNPVLSRRGPLALRCPSPVHGRVLGVLLIGTREPGRFTDDGPSSPAGRGLPGPGDRAYRLCTASAKYVLAEQATHAQRLSI
jgi:hypothetical protein